MASMSISERLILTQPEVAAKLLKRVRHAERQRRRQEFSRRKKR